MKTSTPVKQATNQKFLQQVTRWTPLPALILLILVFIIGAATTPYFLRYSYISRIWGTYMPTILISLGLSVVIIGGGIDLSVGTLASLVNVVCVYLIKGMGWGLGEALLAGMMVGLLFGAINGALTSILRLNSLITTFAVSWVTGGLALWLYPDNSRYSQVAELSNIYQSSYLGIPAPFYLLAFGLIVWYVIMGSPIGPQIYATGNDLKRTWLTGVNVTRTQMASFLFSGFTAGLAGWAMIGVYGVGMAAAGGDYLLPAIAACVIGGVSIMGGVGAAYGPVIGGLFLAFLTALVLAIKLDPYFQQLTKNAIIFLSIVVPSLIWFIVRRKSR